MKEKAIGVVVSDNPAGPHYFKGILHEVAGNTNTNHQAIIDYKG